MKQSMHPVGKKIASKITLNCSFCLFDNSVESKECSIEQNEQSLRLLLYRRSESLTVLFRQEGCLRYQQSGMALQGQ